MAPQRDEIFKQKVNDCVQHIIAEVHQFARNSAMEFQNICNEMVAQFFGATLYAKYKKWTSKSTRKAKLLKLSTKLKFIRNGSSKAEYKNYSY